MKNLSDENLIDEGFEKLKSLQDFTNAMIVMGALISIEVVFLLFGFLGIFIHIFVLMFYILLSFYYFREYKKLNNDIKEILEELNNQKHKKK